MKEVKDRFRESRRKKNRPPTHPCVVCNKPVQEQWIEWKKRLKQERRCKAETVDLEGAQKGFPMRKKVSNKHEQQRKRKKQKTRIRKFLYSSSSSTEDDKTK